jgi:hypothetical protein
LDLVPAGELPEHQDAGGIAESEQDGEQPVDQRAVDQAVKVVQPVSKDGHADGRWDHHQAQAADCRVEQGWNAADRPTRVQVGK